MAMMAEQVLDVEFAGVLLDGPGGEGMAKAVGVAAGHVGGASAAAEQLLEGRWAGAARRAAAGWAR